LPSRDFAVTISASSACQIWRAFFNGDHDHRVDSVRGSKTSFLGFSGMYIYNIGIQ